MTGQANPLAGLGILITRPAGQAGGLAARIAALGGHPILFPAIEIGPPARPDVLAALIDQLPAYQVAIFVSPTSVERAWPWIQSRHGGWPAGVTAAAVGQATAAALLRAGVANVRVAETGADSESLLALSEFADVAGQRVLIVRGEGGRDLMADTLRQRGAKVECAECYRRLRPAVDAAPLLRQWQAGGVAAVTVTSREVFDNLVALLGEAGASRLQDTPLFAPHPRIAEAARAWGVADVVTTPAGDAGLVSGLVDWFNSSHD